MPRDLTDLMERATSSAPPEPHAAADITRLAAHRQRRRTTGLAAAAAVAVVAATGLGYGVTRGHDTSPQPAGTYRYGLHQTLSDAIPASSDRGFRTLGYGLPSVLPQGGSDRAWGRYHSVDAHGRLVVRDVKTVSDLVARFSYQLVARPDGPVHDVAQPPVAPLNRLGHDLQWDVTLTDDGHLLWQPSGVLETNGKLAAELSDLDGAHRQPLEADLSAIPVHTVQGFAAVRRLWVDGGTAYLSVVTRDNGNATTPVQRVSLYSFPVSDPTHLRAESAHDVLSIDESHGTAVWVDAHATHVLAEDLATGATHVVPVPMGAGCRLSPPQSYFQGTLSLLRTNGDLVALTEVCGHSSRIVVSDLSGRLVAQVDPGPGGGFYGMALGERTLTFGSITGSTRWYADDLTTGTLLGLGPGSYQNIDDAASSAGPYVLWYDGNGGHVARFAH